MSFIKKGLKKVWNFVKKYWKEIVMVAAIVFTAGIATVGVAGFSAAMAAGGGGVGGFFSAVGSTMWAGVTATAGSMGLGSGANVGAGSAFAQAGIAGGAQHVGLGAAMGAGGGYGMGAAGKAAEAAAIEAATAPISTSAAQSVGVLRPEVAAQQAGNLATNPVTGEAITSQTLQAAEAAELGASEVTTSALSKTAAGGSAAGEGMSMGKAMLYSTAVSTGGSMLQGYAQGKAMEEQNQPLAAWGVATSKGGRKGSVDDYLFEGAVMQPLAGDVADANVAAEALVQEQMGAPSARALAPSLMTQPGTPMQFAERTQGNPISSNPMDLMSYNPNQMKMGGTPQSLMPSMNPEDWRLQV